MNLRTLWSKPSKPMAVLANLELRSDAQSSKSSTIRMKSRIQRTDRSRHCTGRTRKPDNASKHSSTCWWRSWSKSTWISTRLIIQNRSLCLRRVWTQSHRGALINSPALPVSNQMVTNPFCSRCSSSFNLEEVEDQLQFQTWNLQIKAPQKQPQEFSSPKRRTQDILLHSVLVKVLCPRRSPLPMPTQPTSTSKRQTACLTSFPERKRAASRLNLVVLISLQGVSREWSSRLPISTSSTTRTSSRSRKTCLKKRWALGKVRWGTIWALRSVRVWVLTLQLTL